ncbi:N-acyl-aromatic-L-amino acid amidohydrolase (carboxylate-forming) B-like isoform X1 [Xyrauchen texanus]|uniref:N-acyl-aromatic-L-amino acid amidohydrolase (carboxylate-forming) B-like isoform X1 n=1 Tax=Xyrauchen texanus TaxID=154827 RepID=UPI0022424D07|nr:N-acyl-aromatic-L-amino acid amidohydrolase (carboxylate-forming) B-like isoform X1 [Xyrauchen texanus]XP_051982989.1 N-acyl-aromatic-L-amino acid amidohydrolase (carboxylate-forming) B-like isoform X1 [Xyrauchen texanus]
MGSTFLPTVGRMAVCGGTHGNEMSGVYIVREMERQRRVMGDGVWPIPVTTVLSNPRAVKECRRYIDTDMNRCFSSAILSSPITDSSPYEVWRAQDLNALLGPKGSAGAIDMICDLHNTTSNMGLTLIHYTTNDWVNMHICKYLQTKITQVPVRVVILEVPISDAYSLESVSKHGFTMEVGPQPHGVIRADIYNLMKEGVDMTIDWIQKFNSGTVFDGGEVEVFIWHKSVDYPRDPDTQELNAVIHPQLQDRDFCQLKKGDPLFLSFSGETVKYEEESLYPFFINECAYYEKGIAFHLAKKIKLPIPTVQVQKD